MGWSIHASFDDDHAIFRNYEAFGDLTQMDWENWEGQSSPANGLR